MINVIGDSYGSAIVHHLSRKDLAMQDQINVEEDTDTRSGQGHVNTHKTDAQEHLLNGNLKV